MRTAHEPSDIKTPRLFDVVRPGSDPQLHRAQKRRPPMWVRRIGVHLIVGGRCGSVVLRGINMLKREVQSEVH